MKSRNLNFLESSGPLQAYNGTALPSLVLLRCIPVPSPEEVPPIPQTQNYTFRSLVNTFSWYQLLSLYNCLRELLETVRHKTALQNCQSKVRARGPLQVVRGLVEVPRRTYMSCDTRLNCRSAGGQ
jgi:hypothetical protein